MAEFIYCRICLVTDVKMYSLDATINGTLGVVYRHLTEFPTCIENQYACFECTSLLHKYEQFKSKCVRAQEILKKYEMDRIKVTKTNLQKHRKISKLESKISVCHTKVDDVITFFDSKDILYTEHYEILKENMNGGTDIKKIGDIKVECDQVPVNDEIVHGEPFDYHENIYNDNDESLELNTTEKPTQPVSKRKRIKEPKTKKRKKIKTIKTVTDDNLSDNEPLSKSITLNKTKKNEEIKAGNDLSYFEDYATIVLLTPEEARKEVVLRKESSNYINSTFKCDLCYRGYEVKAAFDNHMKKHSMEHGEYECDICHLRFSRSIYLCKHRLACHKRKFICKLCPYVCFCTVQAKAHVSLHKGKKYPCKICGEIFSMQNSLYMHKRMKHLKESVVESVCEHCGSTFGTVRGLFLHAYKVHSQDKNEKLGPQCAECDVHFSSEAAWKRHLVLSSKHTVSNGCKSCGETFSSVTELKSHMRVHARKHFKTCDSVKLPAKCAFCDKWLSDRGEYTAHMRAVHPQCDDVNNIREHRATSAPYVCEVCGHAFKQQCYLTYHQRKHTGERPYKCGECGKTFQLAGALSVHASTHARARAHACDMCARVFTFKSALNKHIKMHLGIRPHKCAICDKGFIHQCDLKLHIKYVHDKVPWPKKKNKRTSEDTFIEYS